MKEYYSVPILKLLSDLGTTEEGLSENEAKKRIEQYGLNELEEKNPISALKIFLLQFKSFLVFILIAAVIISVIINHLLDAIVISIILVLNSIFGFVQEYRAEKSIQKLKKLSSLQAIVVRDKLEKKIDSKNLVPGDIILLETGDKVPVDARIISSTNLTTQESTLTGESVPTKKGDFLLKKNLPLAERKNMVFSGTIINTGRAKVIVTSTGMHSEIGKIATLIQTDKIKLTPLQVKLKKLGETLGILTIIICLVVFFAGILIGNEVSTMLITAISLAVAAIPEGLTVVVTISLAIGIQKMIKKNSLIRKLPSVETLGGTNVICTDKTGTLTLNQMTVRKIYVNDKKITVTGRGIETTGDFYFENKKVDPKEIEMLLKIGIFCNNSKLRGDELIGDPTEGSLLVSGAKCGFNKTELDNKYKRIDEIEFTSERKLMSTHVEIDSKKYVFTKGAVDILLDKCTKIEIDGHVRKLTQKDKDKILKVNANFTKLALRVLGFSYKESSKLTEKDLVFVGMQAMIDPPRTEVKDAIKKCEKAGINVIMITGDHKLTAEAIGHELGLIGKTIDCREIDSIKDFEKEVDKISIYARAEPKHKVKILEALKKKDYVVAMTGDGVNDAPALKKADIGISMGISGTDVAQEASDMILTDDNFASIVNAVEEGRGIYNNIKQFVQYTLSSNFGEILIIFMAIMFGWPLPLIAIQILWVNLLTDGLPGLALGLDPSNEDLMKLRPRKRKENIITKDVIHNIIIVSTVMCIGTLSMFYLYGIETLKAKSIAFTVLICFQLFNVLTYRANNFKFDIFKNKFLFGSVLISIFLQILVLYTPLSIAFRTIPLGLIDWVYVILVSSSLYFILEIRKIYLKIV
jgi:P-type Ca2+ transporter type 2C